MKPSCVLLEIYKFCWSRSDDNKLVYERRGSVQLAGFIDVDWEGCVEDKISTSGCCFSIGSWVVSWFSSKKKSVALSSIEVEYMETSRLLVRVCGLGSYFQGCSSVI